MVVATDSRTNLELALQQTGALYSSPGWFRPPGRPFAVALDQPLLARIAAARSHTPRRQLYRKPEGLRLQPGDSLKLVGLVLW